MRRALWATLAIAAMCESQVPPNPLNGPWELLPIAGDLEELTKFYVTNIDDLPTDRDSTVDIFIFQPAHDTIWVKSIRGASDDPTRIQIPMSDSYVTRVVRFDNDDYPDLIQISKTKKTVRVLLNRVHENQERIKREALNPDATSAENKHDDDWINKDLLTTASLVEYTDILYGDINGDGIWDIVLAGRRADRTSFIQLLVFSDQGTFSYQSIEIAIDSNGISQLLAIADINKDKRNELIYLTNNNQVAYIINSDPVYKSMMILSSSLSLKGRAKHFFLVDLQESGASDFLIPTDTELVLLRQTQNTWQKVVLIATTLKDADVFDVTHSAKTDILLLWPDKIGLLSQTYIPRGDSEIEVDYKWQTADGTIFGYVQYPLEIEAGNWDSFVATDLSGTGLLDLILYSEAEHKIVWGRRASKTPYGLGWDPNFWVYIMTYVIGASLVLLSMHFYWDSKLQEEERKLLGDAESPKSPWESSNEPPSSGKRASYRKTTV